MADSHVQQTLGEEIANSVTHGIGAILSLAGLIVLVIIASTRGTAWHIVASVVYGVCLLLLYLCSTLYHALPGVRVKRLFRIFDHSAIYLLIAGTYTPFTLVNLRGVWGWSLFGVVWTLAACGIVFKGLFIGRLEMLSSAVYVAMGWVVVVAIRPLLSVLPWEGFLWLLAGGVAYTAGLLFYASKTRYAHAVWHLFVLAGSVLHFCAVYRYVLPHRG